MENKKIEPYIDIYKGLLILLVIIGHSPSCPDWLEQWIYAFHMPAFFAAYGLSYSIARHKQRLEKEKGFWSFIVQKIKRLVIPYILFALIYCELEPRNLIYVAYGSSQTLTEAGSLSSLWYLTCMFVATLIFESVIYLIKKFKNSRIYIVIVTFSIVSIGVAFLLPKFDMGYPWESNVAFMACGFIVIGLFVGIAVKHFSEKKGFFIALAIIAIVSFAVLTLTYKINMNNITISHASMAKAHYGSPLLYFCDATLGMQFIVSISIIVDKLLKNKAKLLCSIGIKSMGIYLIHKPVLLMMDLVLSKMTSIKALVLFFGCIFTLVISLFLAKAIRQYVPELFGENPYQRKA